MNGTFILIVTHLMTGQCSMHIPNRKIQHQTAGRITHAIFIDRKSPLLNMKSISNTGHVVIGDVRRDKFRYMDNLSLYEYTPMDRINYLIRCTGYNKNDVPEECIKQIVKVVKKHAGAQEVEVLLESNKWREYRTSSPREGIVFVHENNMNNLEILNSSDGILKNVNVLLHFIFGVNTIMEGEL